MNFKRYYSDRESSFSPYTQYPVITNVSAMFVIVSFRFKFHQTSSDYIYDPHSVSYRRFEAKITSFSSVGDTRKELDTTHDQCVGKLLDIL